jgi:hypothetical protein
MTSKFIPPNGSLLPQKRMDFQLPGNPIVKSLIIAPANFKFLDRVRVKLQRSAVLELQNSEWAKFYSGATGRIIRFNIEDGTLVVVLDTGSVLSDTDRIMECFEENDLERIDDEGNLDPLVSQAAEA